MSPSNVVPVSEWTDDEWLWVMSEFSPETNIDVAEKAVARRRDQNES